MNILAVRDMHCIVFFPSFKFTERGEKNKFSGRKQNTSNAVAEHIRNQTLCYCWTLYFAIPQNGGHRLFILVSASNDLSSSDPSGSSGSDETDLLTSAGSPPDGGGLADVLMVTSSVGMLHGVHSNTTNLNDKW